MAVNIDWDSIDTVEDLDKQYKKALARAEEAEEPSVRLEWAEAKGQFYERRAAKAELSVAKQAALDKYPLAKEFADEIRGTTPQEVESSAKRFHERVEKLQGDQATAKQKAADDEAAARAAAQQAYGAPAGAGGGTPIPPAPAGFEADDKYIRDRLMQGDGLQGSKDKIVQQRWQGVRIANAMDAAIRQPSYRSFARPGTPEDKRVTDDRVARKNAPK